MALYAVAFLGTTPIGSPLVGWISQAFSPRVALAVGGTATVVASVVTRRHHQRGHVRAAVEPAVIEEAEPGSELGVA
jgi:hypothetical protein